MEDEYMHDEDNGVEVEEEQHQDSSPTRGNTPLEPELEGGNFIKVSAKGQVKSIAGKIAHSAREGDPPAALCIGAECLNLAVKAVAIARTYLTDDGIDLSFQPAFRDPNREKKSIALYIAKTKPRAPISTVDDVEMPIGSQSKPQVVAGALAARIREQRTVCLVAIGIDAVSNAVLAIGNARLYLEQDHKDIRAAPSFVQVHKNGRDLNAVKFTLTVENI
ncbi:hypothetical protein HYH03_009050 [Edaphochlamys debaryana]|uniref:Stage V sporulation protein S n=1 Tax=Edaphochlamys debaryana TaxID=47281 RepID=A0A835Y7W5_9CHLO|nr:hypothetical protein HYH03_009050 [Edaphochlamys debaryana]|eukprot:KAG2492634.1 hypothetical protein HYH03_009050 [Edaphochlamys debaryana]